MNVRSTTVTERLYETDASVMFFTASVLSCEARADGLFAVVLDRTAFFPTGGGQQYDEGVLNGSPVHGVSI